MRGTNTRPHSSPPINCAPAVFEMNTKVVVSTNWDRPVSGLGSHFSLAAGMITGGEKHSAMAHGAVTSGLGASLRQ